MSLTHDINIVNEALARLPGWLQNSPNLIQLITILAKRFQILEDTGWSMFSTRDIFTATNTQLDVIGRFLNTIRSSGETDTTYRTRLLGVINSILQSGINESLISASVELYPGSLIITYDINPATIEIQISNSVDNGIDSDTINTLNKVRAAGVNILIDISTNGGVSGDFQFSDISQIDGSGNGPFDGLHGWGDSTNGAIGGIWMRVIL